MPLLGALTLKGLHVQGEMVESRDKENKFLGYRYVGHTKTPAGNRIIPLNREAIKILSLVRESNSENKWPTGEDDFIFLREHKGIVCPCTTRCFESRIKKYCRKAEMDVLKSQHDVRRTFATNLFYSGMNPKNIQALMGHENLEQTMDYIKRKDINENVLNNLEGISSGVDNILKVV